MGDCFEIDAELHGSGSSLEFITRKGETIRIGYDEAEGGWFVDTRATDGPSDWFRRKVFAPGLYPAATARHVRVYFDGTSVELFADGGATLLTTLVFTAGKIDRLEARGAAGTVYAYAKVR